MSIGRTLAVSVALASSLVLGACHRPQGALMAATGSSQTYPSYETSPKSIHVLDLRTGEVIFAMDVPPGKQLSMDFVEGEGDDPVYTPDLMRYEVFDLGTMTGALANSMTVPGASSRRVDVFIRQGPEFRASAPEHEYRTDLPGERPAWWTPAGGAMPDDRKGLKNYDGN